MHLYSLSPKAGWDQFIQGIRIFSQRPLSFLAIFLAYIFLMLMLFKTPWIGFLLPLFFVPGLSVSFMVASRAVQEGESVTPLVLFDGFAKHGWEVAYHLLILGVLYVGATWIVLSIAYLIDGGVLMQFMVWGRRVQHARLTHQPAVLTSTAVAALLFIPISMLFWFAPILTVWQRISPYKALFFSFIACWRNKGAFLVYALLWGGFGFLTSTALVFVLHWLRADALILTLLMSFSLIFTTMFYCSFYATYCGCFGRFNTAKTIAKTTTKT